MSSSPASSSPAPSPPGSSPSPCESCPFRDDPDPAVVCAAIRTRAPKLCTPRFAEAVRRLTLQPLGRYVAPVYRTPTPSAVAPDPSLLGSPAFAAGAAGASGVPWVEPPVARQLVVARYREDLNWLADVPSDIDIIVYNCGPELRKADGWPTRREGCPAGVGASVVARENRGDEAAAYARHVVDRYDELALLTFFAQGHPFDHSPDFVARLSAPWDRPTTLTTRYSPGWPPESVTSRDHAESHHGFVVKYGHVDAHPADRSPWGELFDVPAPHPWLFGYAACWAVPWWAIRARPRPFWRWLRAAIERSCPVGRRASPAERGFNGFFMEIAWMYLFMSPTLYPHRAECSARGEGAT